MAKFKNEQLNFDLQKILGYDEINLKTEDFLDDSYVMDVNDQAYWYYNVEERDSDYKELLFAITKPKQNKQVPLGTKPITSVKNYDRFATFVIMNEEGYPIAVVNARPNEDFLFRIEIALQEHLDTIEDLLLVFDCEGGDFKFVDYMHQDIAMKVMLAESYDEYNYTLATIESYG